MGKAYLSGRTALARALAAVTILLGVALALPVLPAEASSVPTNGTDVGGMNLSAYCSGLGFSGSGLRRAQNGADAAYNNWICLKSGSTEKIPIDLNAACSKTFAQRPLLAETPNSDDAFAWHCYQTSSSTPQGLTGTIVGCNFIVASADDVCTATVTDDGVPSKAELHKLKHRHIHQFKARLKLTIESLSGRVLDSRTMLITVHVR